MEFSNKRPKISDTEWEVMRVIWDAPEPLTAGEIIEKLADANHWRPKTVRSFLNRLVAKGVLSAEKRTFRAVERLHYIPLFERDELLAGKQKSLLRRFFGGTVQSMLAGFIESGDLSEAELGELRKMIDEKLEN